MLWPDRAPDKGRHALSQTLYALRRDVGADIVVATHELMLNRDVLSVDLDDFREALRSADYSRASALYTGPFLDGFLLGDAAEFERWVDEERATLAREVGRALEGSARSLEQRGRWSEAAAEWQRLTSIDPLNSRAASSYMEALVAAGDRARAVAHGREHVAFLRSEFGAEPDASFQRLLGRLGEPSGHPTDNARVNETPAAVGAPPESGHSNEGQQVPTRGSRRSWVSRSVLLAGAVVLSIGVWRGLAMRSPSAGPTVLAVGQIRDLVTPDSARLGGVLSEILATSLARLTDIQLIANSRVLELMPRGADTLRAARTDAARRAGATEVLEGELTPLPGQQLRLSVRRVDIARGLVRRGYQVTSSDRMALLDSVTVLIAADLRVGAPTGSLAEISTRSPIAYRLYEDGLRAFYQFDVPAALRLFRASLVEDSTFAMATYYAWRAAVAVESSGEDSLADRAVLLASRASDRDRLLILAHVGATRSDLGALAAAESLAKRFPEDPEALIRAAQVIPNLSRALALLERAVVRDSSAGIDAGFTCRLCGGPSTVGASTTGPTRVPASSAP
ncbi:MAG: hypothetical protein IPF47_01575 [Gemmatimonadetes bacterium]|nr:hypothetical protein [Gemmatimonadota bacterium]